MSYTPTMDELREAWLQAESEERDASTSDDDLRAEFDRALAAHDAEKDRLAEAVQAAHNALHMETRERAIAIHHDALSGVVAEEPEWEYGEKSPGSDYVWGPWTAEKAESLDIPRDLLVRRRKAGTWVPVKQEAAP